MRIKTVPLTTAVVATFVTACGGGSSGGVTLNPPPPPPPTATFDVQQVFPALSFNQPVAMLQAPGDPSTWYVIERAGRILTFANDPAAASTAVFADLTAIIDSGPGEAGLLGMAFDPAFATNGHVFLSYTTTGAPLISRIVRFTTNAGGATLDLNSAVEVINVPQNGGNHNGGQVSFGPDGFLYVAFGDGGGAGDPADNGQQPTNLRGAMLRLDIQSDASYTIPASNPFAGNATCPAGFGAAACPEIFAYGLRNPWRFSFDRQTGVLLAGDVGQGSLEEIDRIDVGGNYGWNVREGNECFNAATCPTAGFTDPIHVYGRNDGVSVTGGYVYRGSAAPALAGRYVFGDFGTGRIWSIDPDVQTPGPSTLLVESGLSIASFGEDTAGELYVIDYGGALYQLIEN
ncbi:MAG: PQQ-dependent sugar dehydrogenase [Pseudomonadota bacterium]